ncbi:MAG: hypothetical protein GF313_09660 [Caldithrix sp.]|nr:hypothetical protein [Caldithrix sp.]
MNIKLFLLLIILLALLAYGLLPRTRLARRFKMNETLFYMMNIIGVLCGVVGLIVTLIWPHTILSHHYFELILLPAFLVFLFAAAVMNIQSPDAPYDEKQNHDMTTAAALSLPFSVGGMFLLYAMYKEGMIDGLMWFPVFIFLSLTVFSSATLYYYKHR